VPGTADGVIVGPDGLGVGGLSGLGGVGGVKGRQSGQRFLGGWEISLNPGPWNIKVSLILFAFRLGMRGTD
jgi:hypothetical protein